MEIYRIFLIYLITAIIIIVMVLLNIICEVINYIIANHLSLYYCV